jgi:hypothetical protein
MAACMMAAGTIAAAAEEMQAPRLSYFNPDWNGVAADLSSIAPPSPAQSVEPVPDAADTVGG